MSAKVPLGASSGSREPGLASRPGPSGFDPERTASRHPYYGGCDGFGPLGMCSECTDVIHCDDGSFTDNTTSNKLTQGQVADRVRAFLLREAECAALAAATHTSEPKELSAFVGRVMSEVLPNNFGAERPVGEQPF